MVRIFVYEHLTAGGWSAADGDRPPPSLVAEGRAMAEALAADFTATPGVQFTLLRDVRLNDWRPVADEVIDVGDARAAEATFDRLAAEADWTVVIAPEIGGRLLDYCRRVEMLGGRSLGPRSSLVELCADKQRTAEHLHAAGVPVPPGIAHVWGRPWPADFPYPAVWKPRDGAGSLGLRSILSAAEKTTYDRGAGFSPAGRLERLCMGTAVSVACLCAVTQPFPLTPCRQLLTDDGTFRYLGGSLPLNAGQAQRATRLAAQAVATLPNARGYLGVDLVLGDAEDGRDDFVIEINPRLTTSYIGLRAACRQNLAKAMLQAAAGDCPSLLFHSDPLKFWADGSVKKKDES